MKTFVNIYKCFLTLHSSSSIFEKVNLHFYRYDDWCKTNIPICQQTWGRLEGIKVSVGIREQGDSSLIGKFVGRPGKDTIT